MSTTMATVFYKIF